MTTSQMSDELSEDYFVRHQLPNYSGNGERNVVLQATLEQISDLAQTLNQRRPHLTRQQVDRLNQINDMLNNLFDELAETSDLLAGQPADEIYSEEVLTLTSLLKQISLTATQLNQVFQSFNDQQFQEVDYIYNQLSKIVYSR